MSPFLPPESTKKDKKREQKKKEKEKNKAFVSRRGLANTNQRLSHHVPTFSLMSHRGNFNKTHLSLSFGHFHSGSSSPLRTPIYILFCLALSFSVFLSDRRLQYCSLEVTITSLHPPRLCRIAVFSIKPTFLSFHLSLIIRRAST